jgi:tryptophan synthase beta chain
MSPLLSHVYDQGLISAEAVAQTECFEAGVLFARTEGIVPAPEPTHALATTIREARRCAETGEEKVLLTALCGHGHLDLAAYDSFLSGRLVDEDVPDSRFADALARLPDVSRV